MEDYLRIIVAGMLLGMLPLIGSANEPISSGGSVTSYLSFSEVTLIDSLPKAKRQDDKDKDKKKDPKKGTEGDRKDPRKDPKIDEIDPKKPNIREVPKARPKLRPGAVTDRVKIKRPPVRVKPGRVLHLLGI